ncbi:MAG TPA: response regulator transcription factor [Chitinophagales bacterium]|nr:response regulator transcription factor [Chitinophagales bacterium]
MNPQQINILIADDEPDTLEFIGYNLRKEGYNLATANNGNEVLTIAPIFKPHLILLDIMMPELDGIQTCAALRKLPDFENTLIVFLTARNEEFTQVMALDTGGDDFINKPIKPGLLLSKIKSILRRLDQKNTAATANKNNATNQSEANNESATIYFSGLEINRERFVVIQNNTTFELPKKEFDLLYLLATKPGKVFTRHEILQKIWGSEVIVTDRTIDVHIRKLREKLGEKLIKTAAGVGYKLNV